ncbi:hypothetical protein [Aneurinibacillus migulanus]|uniref:hypothetical protein n=1 Tax=Aneurinibacillus migulanus TaxID=47500 RepID=UPI0020A0BF5A|nr:hypothetical protein [Aneurinibacillus migulanus]MCP1357427.1 hypothetical protein [Aneurinibacillus migulanus]MED4726868.1 hypothetical protein [Aneurinibacillus migulanus]
MGIGEIVVSILATIAATAACINSALNKEAAEINKQVKELELELKRLELEEKHKPRRVWRRYRG